jgi:signal transduction histidine kinase
VKYKVLLIFFVVELLCVTPAFSEKNIISDSKVTYDSIIYEIDSIFKLSQLFLFSDPDSSRKIIEQGTQLAAKLEDTDWQIRYLNLYGTSYAIQSDFYNALYYYHQALELATKTRNHERIANAYNNLGNIHYLSGNYKNALENFLEALSHYKSAANSSMIVNVHLSIGELYEELSNFEKAFYHYNIAYQGFLELDNRAGLSATLNNLGSAYLKTSQIDSSLFYLNQAISMALSSNNQYNLGQSYAICGDVYIISGNNSKALEYYSKSQTVAQDLGNKSMLSSVNIRLAKVYIKLGKINIAIQHVERALHDAEDIKDLKLIQWAHEVFASIYENIGNYKKSLEHYRRADEIKKNLINQAELHQIYNIEISQLYKDKEIQQLEIERQQLLISKRNSSLVLISIASLSIIIILVLVYYLFMNKFRHKQKSKMNDLVIKHIEDRAKSAFDAEIFERQRLGQELHDGIGPLLSLSKLNITALIENEHMDVERRLIIINNTLNTINLVLKEMKQISHNMAPVVLMEKGFEAAVREIVLLLNESDKYKVTLDIFGLNGRLEPHIEHVLYRALQEIVSNFIQHAKATEMSIQIVQNAQDLTIMVEDNGIGFSEESIKASRGIGLKSTATRIKSINGQFLLDTSIGKGSIISIILPLKPNSNYE